MRNRFLAIATVAAVATTSVLAPSAASQVQPENPVVGKDAFQYKFDLPNREPHDVVLQVGETQDSVRLNWVTTFGITGQSVRIYEAGTDASTAKEVAATSADAEVNLTEGPLDEPDLQQFFAPIAHHKATVTGLKENTKYVYTVGSKADGWSKEYAFTTGSYGDSWNFLFFGDPKLYNTQDLDGKTDAWANTVNQATAKYPKSAFLLSAGNQSGHSAYIEHSKFLSPEQMRKYRLAVNNGSNDNIHKPTYNAMYNHPTQGDENYWFAYNNALIVSLDSNDVQDIEDDAVFVRNTIAQQAKGKDWVIVTFHHRQEDQQFTQWRERMTQVFAEADVDLVLSGSGDAYSRTKVPEGNKAGGVEKQEGEVQYVTVGPTPDWTSVEVSPESLKVSTSDGQGGNVDSFTLTRAVEGTQPSGSSKAGIAFGILAGLLALIGGGLLFASQSGLLPKELKDLFPF